MSSLVILPTSNGWEGDGLDYSDAKAGGIQGFPDLLPAQVFLVPERDQMLPRSPMTLAQQARDGGEHGWRIIVRMQPMEAAAAAVFVDFAHQLEGSFGMFTLDLDPHLPGWVPLQGVRVFRCTAAVQPGWESTLGVVWDARLEAREVIGEQVAQSDVVNASRPGWEGGALDYEDDFEQANVTALSAGWEGGRDADL